MTDEKQKILVSQKLTPNNSDLLLVVRSKQVEEGKVLIDFSFNQDVFIGYSLYNQWLVLTTILKQIFNQIASFGNETFMSLTQVLQELGKKKN